MRDGVDPAKGEAMLDLESAENKAAPSSYFTTFMHLNLSLKRSKTQSLPVP